MKLWVLRLCAVLGAVVLLTGCGGASSVDPITSGFTCHTAMQYREMAVEGTLTCSTDGRATLAFTLPKSLQGVTLGWDGDGMSMELGGMRMDVPTDKVPEGALIRCLLTVLTASHPTGELTDEGYVIHGQADYLTYTLVCDPHAGLPLSLSIPDEPLEAVFTDVTRLSDTSQT